MIETINRLYSRFTKNLSEVSKIDGRFLLLTLLVFYFLPLVFIVFSNSYADKWNSKWIYPLVPKMFPPFADMRVIAAGSECIRMGYDVLIENPCDPLLRQMNYPRIWSIPAAWGLDQSHTVGLGILCGFLFFISVFFMVERLNYIQASIYALILCSPSVMLVVERGNIDSIMFILLAISLLVSQSKNLTLRIIGYVLIFFASILKLYPIFALISCIKEKKSIFIFIRGSRQQYYRQLLLGALRSTPQPPYIRSSFARQFFCGSPWRKL